MYIMCPLTPKSFIQYCLVKVLLVLCVRKTLCGTYIKCPLMPMSFLQYCLVRVLLVLCVRKTLCGMYIMCPLTPYSFLQYCLIRVLPVLCIKRASYRTTISDLDASIRVFEICLLSMKIAILQPASQDPLRGLLIIHVANKFPYFVTFARSVTVQQKKFITPVPYNELGAVTYIMTQQSLYVLDE